MLAEIIPDLYDYAGKKIFKPTKGKHRIFRPTFPMEMFLRVELKEKCDSFEDIRRFVDKCEYVSDEEQFNQKDYWMPPDEFEKVKKGDCEDFALWTWRQLIKMGYSCRFVVGYSGKYGSGHAWLTVTDKEKQYIFEPLASHMGLKMPRFSCIFSRPEISVEWDGNKIQYYEHTRKAWKPSFIKIISLLGEWFIFWIQFWIKVIFGFLLLPFYLILNMFKKRKEK